MCQAFGGIRGGSRYDEDARVHDAVGHLDVDVSAPAGVELVPVTDARRVSALVDVHDEVFGGDHAAIGSAITAALAAQLRPVEAVVAVAGDTAISAGTDAAC